MNIGSKFLRSFLSVAALSIVSAGFAQGVAKPAQPPVTLHVGDMAPPVADVTWMKGKPLDLKDGKIHVVEFWATWCGPCKAAMPELSRLAEQYKGQVTFTGIDVWESHSPDKGIDTMPKVKQFVEGAHGKMAYNVGADGPAAVMTNTWLIAAGQHGIPCTFVVDEQARLAYIGHPIFLDEVLPKVLNHTFDATAFKATSKAEMAKLSDLEKQIETASKVGDANKVLDLYDESDRDVPWAADQVAIQRYGLLAVTKPTEAHAYGEKLLKTYWNASDTLCWLSRTILGDEVGFFFNKSFGSIKSPDYALAPKAMKQAQRCSDRSDVLVNMTVAEAYFKTGSATEATEYQARVVGTLTEDKTLHVADDVIAKAETALESYRAAAKTADSRAGQ